MTRTAGWETRPAVFVIVSERLVSLVVFSATVDAPVIWFPENVSETVEVSCSLAVTERDCLHQAPFVTLLVQYQLQFLSCGSRFEPFPKLL